MSETTYQKIAKKLHIHNRLDAFAFGFACGILFIIILAVLILR